MVELVSCAIAGVATMVAATGTNNAAHERSRKAFFTEKLPRKTTGCW
jgi:hypothetical protein